MNKAENFIQQIEPIRRNEIDFTDEVYGKLEFRHRGSDYTFDLETTQIKKEIAYTQDPENVTMDEITNYICDHPELWKELKP